ncbi:MAG: S8 family peptidase [Acidimicrobiales bacterium]
MIVVFDDEVASPKQTLENVGLTVDDARDMGAKGYEPPGPGEPKAVYLDTLKVAVVPGDAGPVQELRSQSGVIIEAERFVFTATDNLIDAAAFGDGPHSSRPKPFIQGDVGAYPFIQGPVGAYPFIQGPVGAYPFIQSGPAAMVTYLAGFRDAAQGLLDRFAAQSMMAAVDESQATWGLQAIGALLSRLSGRGVGVAVLDTGFDARHPDFRDRDIVTKSFITGESADDGHGHGTHCIGTACGPWEPDRPPRYGIAYNAKIFAGKVLSNDGVGTDGEVLAGMNWAIDSGCKVISMSLGTPVERGARYSRAFERIAQRALNQGTIIVAAAGNESRRDMNIVNPVSHPANCPSILAVAAVDQNMKVAFFSNQGDPAGGGVVDIAAPGMGVYSSYVMPTRYRTMNGTSMATPHVAGVAALFAEIRPDATAAELKQLILETARQIPGAAVDIGAGLVQAP